MVGEQGTLHAVKLIASEKYDERDFFIFESLQKKFGTQFNLKANLLSGTTKFFKSEKYNIWPWESLA